MSPWNLQVVLRTPPPFTDLYFLAFTMFGTLSESRQLTPPIGTKSSSRVQLPVFFLSRRDAHGRDISSYHCDRFCLEATLREHEALKTEWTDVLMVDFSDGAALSYPMLVKKFFDFANSSSSAENS
jgi:hypothetical protein